MNFSANRREPARTKRSFQATGSRCSFGLWLIILFSFIFTGLYAQPLPGGRDDSEVARQYVQWVRQAVNEGRWSEARAAIVRAKDFANVSSDISYLEAVIRTHFLFDNETRLTVIQALDTAIDTNRWENYSRNEALLLKARQQLAVRDYFGVLDSLDLIPQEAAGSAQIRAESAMIRLLALRGMALSPDRGYDRVQALTQFRSLVLSGMDRFSGDPRPLRIFFEYARNRSPQQAAGIFAGGSDLQSGDINLLELALRRLPFLLEADPELAWIAAPLMRDIDAARRITSAYRAGGIPHIQNRDFMPHPGSIPVALNLGLLGDMEAVEELFSGSRGFNNPLPAGFKFEGNPFLDKDIIIETHKLLRSEEGRNFFTQKILSFTGIITSDDDRDGFIDAMSFYNSGILSAFSRDINQDIAFEFEVFFDANGVPVSGKSPVLGYSEPAFIRWERYPSVQLIEWNNIEFRFRPADFQYAPVTFIELGGSNNMDGLLFPVPDNQYISLAYRSFISFCSRITRPSQEIEGAMETIFMERSIPLQAVEELNGRQVSVTEFERGLPVIQHIDLDLDGRMETIRRFRAPSQVWDILNYRSLIASSESDWSGDGRNKTMEVYLPNGSVVYYFDMDGSGEWTYSETINPR